MKAKFITLCLFLTVFASYAQQKIAGQVFDAETKKPLPFVNITINHSKEGTSADIDGRFTIAHREAVQNLTFSFVGYKKVTLAISPNTTFPLAVYLEETTTQLQEVEVFAGENPAHRIIKNAVANREKNNPENLESFSYSSYNKFVVTLDKDSAAVESGLFEDSVMQKVDEVMSKQHLLIMESASERKYKKPNLDNEVITANRVSGLKNPTFVFLANQLQSFSFYDDFVSVLGLDYLNPISGGSTKKYLFLIQDTTFSGSDSTFIISFAPKKGANFTGLKGLLYITTDGWAIKNVVAEPLDQVDFSIEIQQHYKKFANGSWFPYQKNYDFIFNSVGLDGFKPLGIGRTYLSEIKINPELTKDDFTRIAIKVEKDATRQEDDYWNKFRKDTLTAKEKETYRVIDSVGKAEMFDAKLMWLQALTEGKVRWGYFDFPLKHIMRYNLYEGFRLGFGMETNPTLINWLRVGGNFAYGFGDQRWKYGYYAEATLQEEQSLKIGGGYQFDIYESGGQEWIDQPQKSILSDGNTRLLWVEQFDELSQAYGYVSWHPIPNVHAKIQGSRENRFMPGNYAYQTTNDEGQTVWQNGFVASLAQMSLRWAPNEKYMEGAFGRRVLQTAFPVFKAQFTKGLNGVFDGTLDFERLELFIRHDVKTKELGISSFVVEGGKVFGNVPYSYLYSGRSNKPLSYDGFFLVADKYSFETMQNNEFLNDQFVQVMFRQNFQSRFLKIGTWAPDVEVMLRALWGTLNNPELHQGISVKDASKGFYETGIEINKIYTSIGVGAYYRFGPYQLAEYWDNWSVKLSYRVTLF